MLVALPTFNEIESIAEVIALVREQGYECIVVDNQSTDGTIEKAEELNVKVYQRQEFGTGYGCAIRKALKIAKEQGHEFLGILDCDLTYAPADFKILERHLGDNDLVIGARSMKDIAFWRRMGNWVHILFVRLLFWRMVKDINSGMRCIRVNKFIDHLNAPNMGMVAQMTCFAIRNKLPYVEIPISYGERKGHSKIVLIDAYVILQTIFLQRIKARVY